MLIREPEVQMWRRRQISPRRALPEPGSLEAEEVYCRALRAAYPARIAEIQEQFVQGARRRFLIRRYGQDLVDLAIAELVR